jgi:hypothetical protein
MKNEKELKLRKTRKRGNVMLMLVVDAPNIEIHFL